MEYLHSEPYQETDRESHTPLYLEFIDLEKTSVRQGTAELDLGMRTLKHIHCCWNAQHALHQELRNVTPSSLRTRSEAEGKLKGALMLRKAVVFRKADRSKTEYMECIGDRDFVKAEKFK